MFNERDMAALHTAMGMLEGKLSHTGVLTVEDLAIAFDHAGISGLEHDADPLHCPGCDGDHL